LYQVRRKSLKNTLQGFLQATYFQVSLAVMSLTVNAIGDSLLSAQNEQSESTEVVVLTLGLNSLGCLKFKAFDWFQSSLMD